MSSAVIRFEVLLPNADNGTSDFNAVQNFMNSMNTLTECYLYQTNSPLKQYFTFFGYITSLQSATALGFLATLNLALSAPAKCVSMNAATQP